MQSHYANVNGTRLHYVRAGSGPLLLFVHGFPEFWAVWESHLSAFAGEYTVVAPDLRGYNRSDKPEGLAAYRPKVLVEDLRALVAHLGFERCRLVAHDWGGALAWSFAIAHPQCIERLVILNAPHPVPFARELRDNPAQQAASEYIHTLRSADGERAMSEHDFAALRALFGDWKLDAGRQARYREAWSQPGALTAMLNYYRASPMHAPTADAPGVAGLRLEPAQFMVRVPTLVIWGERDAALLPSLLDGLDECVPDLRIERVADASHWVVHEQPQRVETLIREFFAEARA
ncbi:MAG TPA: alpha/beta hydrolase [Solimonas sp.]